MAIKDHVVRRETIEITNTKNSFTVGPLNAVIIIKLMSAHKDTVRRLFDEADARKLIAAPDPMQIAMLIMDVAPEFLAHAIALAADEPDTIDIMRQFPAPVQLEAVHKIFNLTFEAEGGIKKFGETVMALMSLGNQALEAPKTSDIL